MLARDRAKLHLLYSILVKVCDGGKDIYLRRWGNRPTFKCGKLISLIKKKYPALYKEMIHVFDCPENDSQCLCKVMLGLLRVRLKTFDRIETLRDLCHAVTEKRTS